MSQVERKYDQIIDSSCSHHMTSDMNNFFELNRYDGRIFRAGNNAACHIKRIVSITLNSKTNVDDVYFVDGLKHNLLSVGQLVDKGY